MSNNKVGNGHRSFLNTEAVVLGLLLGTLLTAFAGQAYFSGHHLIETPVEETLWTALYLTFLVGYVQFQYPTLFTSRPRVSIFVLCFVAGHVSLVFDSFAVILLFSTLTFLALESTDPNPRFNSFAIKVIASFNALTVGGGFYLGELWGLPHYISSGYDFPSSGLPLLLVLTPYCALTSLLAARRFPVKVENIPFDRVQLEKTIEFGTGLVLLIWTHSPFLCIGALLLYSALRGQTQRLVFNGLHEIREGAASALGLILAALIVQKFPGSEEWVATHIQGPWIMLLASISSPFAGAMIAPATTLHEFYVNISWLMLGATLFVSSSLVAIVVFKEQLAFSDLPRGMQRMPWIAKRGLVQEAEIYTLIMLPLTAGLGVVLWFANRFDLFVAAYNWLH